jgi:hypothetical protein
MPRQTVRECYSPGPWPSPGFSHVEAVVAAQRVIRSHMSHNIINSSSVSPLLTIASPHRDIVAESHSPRRSIYQRNNSRRRIDYRPSHRRAVSHIRSPSSTSPNIHRTITTSASIASFEAQTSLCSEQSSLASTGSSLVCIRDFPTKDTPLPGLQLHFLKDGADSYEPIQESDGYLHDWTLRRRDKGKALSWKSIKKVRVSKQMCYCPWR